jgi:hypothetical protein
MDAVNPPLLAGQAAPRGLNPPTATGTDQTGKRYWQRIEDKFFQLMSPLSSTPIRSYCLLQGRWDSIKTACNRWSNPKNCW